MDGLDKKSDLEVSVNIPADIRFIHQIEREIDDAICKLGFCRTCSSHFGNAVVIGYRQFAASTGGVNE